MKTNLRQLMHTIGREAWSLFYVVTFVGLLMAAYLITNSQPGTPTAPPIAYHHRPVSIAHIKTAVRPVDALLAWVFNRHGLRQAL